MQIYIYIYLYLNIHFKYSQFGTHIHAIHCMIQSGPSQGIVAKSCVASMEKSSKVPGCFMYIYIYVLYTYLVYTQTLSHTHIVCVWVCVCVVCVWREEEEETNLTHDKQKVCVCVNARLYMCLKYHVALIFFWLYDFNNFFFIVCTLSCKWTVKHDKWCVPVTFLV